MNTMLAPVGGVAQSRKMKSLTACWCASTHWSSGRYFRASARWA